MKKPSDFKTGDRVRHLYEEGTVVRVTPDEVLVHYEHGPVGQQFGPQHLTVARYDDAWFALYSDKLQHAPPRNRSRAPEDVGNLLTPILAQMDRVFNGQVNSPNPKYGCLAVVWQLGNHEHHVLANSVSSPELRAVVVEFLTTIDRDIRDADAHQG